MIEVIILDENKKEIELSNGTIHANISKEEAYMLIRSLSSQLCYKYAEKDIAVDQNFNRFCIAILQEE